MASVLDKYGIKEVADITFYALDKAGKPAYPVLYIDTAKTSTIEQTAEETTANGGKGNPTLISWDYNKDITVTLEDALFSAKSLAIMFGDGTVKSLDPTTDAIMRTEVVNLTVSTETDIVNLTEANGYNANYIINGKKYAKQNAKFYNEAGESLAAIPTSGKYFCTYDLKISAGSVIEISANTFPGTYYVTGDTFARAEANGEDEFFQFIISKAKVLSENTITLEAEGDPTVFSMNLHVLRPADGVMMKLVKYDLNGDTYTGGSTSELYHNHTLNAPQESDGDAEAVTDAAKADAARVLGMNGEKTSYIANFLPPESE